MEQSVPPGWYPDPSGRYLHRWYDGSRWSDYAGQNGQQIHDPLIPGGQDEPAISARNPAPATAEVRTPSAPEAGAPLATAPVTEVPVAKSTGPAREKATAFNGKRVAEQLQRENDQLLQRISVLESQLADSNLTAGELRNESHQLRSHVQTLEDAVALVDGMDAAQVAEETRRLTRQKAALEQQLRASTVELQCVKHDLVTNRERVDLETEFGIYDYEHPAEASATLSTHLESVRAQIKSMNKTGQATHAATQFTYNGSSAQGRTFVNQISRIMLRWYNAEAESAVKAVKAGSLHSAMKRLTRVQEQVAKQGVRAEVNITAEYHRLRLEELELAARHLQAVAVEKEREREHRAELREQRKVEQEIAKEKERLAKERSHYENSIQRLRSSGDDIGAHELETRLAEIDEAIAQADYRAANIRAGYVYVISNIGSFGDGVVKIGMTRRLEPMDRVRELGDASVPFRFDVHALFFSDDAVTIEAMLHRHFAEQRINKVNLRREFFLITPQEVLEALREHQVSVLEFRLDPVADEYRASTSTSSPDAPEGDDTRQLTGPGDVIYENVGPGA